MRTCRLECRQCGAAGLGSGLDLEGLIEADLKGPWRNLISRLVIATLRLKRYNRT